MPFNIGPGELILLAAVALLLFGPRRLPEIGKAIGEGISSFKKAVNTMTEIPTPHAAPVQAAATRPPSPASPAQDPPPPGSVALQAPAPEEDRA